MFLAVLDGGADADAVAGSLVRTMRNPDRVSFSVYRNRCYRFPNGGTKSKNGIRVYTGGTKQKKKKRLNRTQKTYICR